MKIILASQSPRRRQLLKEAGLKFEIFVPDYVEKTGRGEKPALLVKRLAFEKARAAAIQAKTESGLVIGADTIVVSESGKILGKPESKKDAYRKLKQIVGRTHLVLTGYCILYVKKYKIQRKLCRVVKTRVSMRSLSSKSIQGYIHKGESMDKAGAYAAQGYGASLIQKIHGSYTNVVGLPISHVLDDLEKEFELRAY